MTTKRSARQAIFLIGFGGPEKAEEVRPFLESVLRGVKIPRERFEAVLAHYEKIGNCSPYNTIARRQKRALEKWLEENGGRFPVYLGFRHASPSFRDAFLALQKDGIERVAAVVLSPFNSYASFGKYKDKVCEAQKEARAESIEMDYVGPFYESSHFLSAQADRVKQILPSANGKAPGKTFFLFSAHSIPVKMSDESGYARQFRGAASAIARGLGLKDWEIAYQSRSGAAEPWLGPDVKEAAAAIDARVFQNVAVIPIGFVSDNAEILYDLDIELKTAVEGRGLRYLRARTVMDDPKFIGMIGTAALRLLKGDA